MRKHVWTSNLIPCTNMKGGMRWRKADLYNICIMYEAIVSLRTGHLHFRGVRVRHFYEDDPGILYRISFEYARP